MCAPRLSTAIGETENECPADSSNKCIDTEYIINGICYWTPRTDTNQPIDIRRISPLRLKSIKHF